MAHWKSGFPSRYLQVSDLELPLIVTVKAVTFETVGSGDSAERKPVMRFQENVKAMVMNLTKSEAVASIAGDDDMDRWPGTRIRLSRGTTRYQGKRVNCINVEAPDDIDATMQPLQEVL